jgi:UDP-galactopyranose mutase
MSCKEKKKVLIVGAGISGATIARLLAEEGYKVHVIEQENKIGGICADTYEKNRPYKQDYGSHIFHTNSKEVWDFINEFSNFLPYQHKVETLVQGILIPMPFNFISMKRLEIYFRLRYQILIT